MCCRRLTIRSERFIKGACSHFIHLRLPNRILHGMFRFIRVVVSDPSFYVSLPDRRSTMIYKANLPFSILPSFDVGRLCCFIYYFFSSYPSSLWFFSLSIYRPVKVKAVVMRQSGFTTTATEKLFFQKE